MSRGAQAKRIHLNCLSLDTDPFDLSFSIPLDFSTPNVTGRTVSNLLQIGQVGRKQRTGDTLECLQIQCLSVSAGDYLSPSFLFSEPDT